MFTALVPFGPPLSRLTGSALVDFNGQLQVDGIQLQSAGIFPSLLLPSLSSELQAIVRTQYVANLDYNVGSQTNFQPVANPGFNYVINSLAVDRIGFDVQNASFVFADGNDGSLTLRAVDPAAIINNGVALAGRFQSVSGPLLFGTISGTASVVGNPGVTTLIDGGGNPLSYLSPFALAVNVTPVVTTRLDEAGLITPTVSVTNGINLNGSTITNVGNGVAAGDATNRAQLNAEANARIASDAQLTASLSSETSQRMAADSSMATRLSALEGSLGNLDARFERLDRRIAAGTAVATAMSGNAFLPDMKFNLTANVATYDGAHAGAIQMGALVSRHVAVNAGVAFGFNRGGKTAARAGMTFGW